MRENEDQNNSEYGHFLRSDMSLSDHYSDNSIDKYKNWQFCGILVIHFKMSLFPLHLQKSYFLSLKI